MLNHNVRILVVDDLTSMRKLLIKHCQMLGFTHFVEAPDGIKAWSLICDAKAPFDLVIADWNMPICSGIELLKRIRSHKRYKDLPVLLVTGKSEKNQILEAIKAGVSGYIVKPFTAESLQKQLDDIQKKRTA